MSPQEFQAYSDQLRTNLVGDARVIGLIFLGSSAGKTRQADEWSDHDFFVIVKSGEQEAFRAQLDWLPDAAQIVFAFRETAHGLKVLYRNGHLIEFAIFDAEELFLAKVNDYAVVIDRDKVAESLAKIARESVAEARDDDYYVGMCLGNLWVGLGRYLRGERLSGHQFVKTHAVARLLTLLARHVKAAHELALDNLDEWRRFERAYPEIGEALNAILLRDVPEAARGLLDVFERELQTKIQDYPQEAVAVIRAMIPEAE
jgi:hypothetical protein